MKYLGVFLLQVLALACLCTAYDPLRFATVPEDVYPSLDVMIDFPDNLTCDACTVLSEAIFTALANQTIDNDALNELDKICDLLPLRILKNDCKKVSENIMKDLEEDASDFFDNYTPWKWCNVHSLCPVGCCTNAPDGLPQQLHLQLVGAASDVIVTWVSSEYDATANVQIGLNSTQLLYQFNATSTTYWEGGWKGFIYNAVLSGLKPSTLYYYKVGTDKWGYSNVTHFTSPPKIDAFGNFTFAALADVGRTSDSADVFTALDKALTIFNISLVVHSGDVAYDGGYQPDWDKWFRMVEPVTRKVPYMAVEGNHENYHRYIPYDSRFNNPLKSSKSNTDRYFSYDWGNIHFLAYTFEEDHLFNQEKWNTEKQWIEQDLIAANSNRANVPWIVCHGHRPLYCSTTSSSRCQKEASQYRDAVEALFNQYNVDLVLTGHNHNYERTLPVFNNVVTSNDYINPTSPVYAVVGTGGIDTNNNWDWPRPAWSKGPRLADFGFAVISTKGPSVLHFQWVSSVGYSIDDNFTIVKNHF